MKRHGPRTAMRAGWNPMKLAPICWLDPDHEYYDPGDPVPTISDRTGNGRSFSQATGSKQPIFRVDAASGQPYLEFDDVDDLLVGDGSSVSASAYVISAVVKHNGGAGGVERAIWSNRRVATNWPTNAIVLRQASFGPWSTWWDEGPHTTVTGSPSSSVFKVITLRMTAAGDSRFFQNLEAGETKSGYATPEITLAHGDINSDNSGAFGGWRIGDLIFIAGSVSDENLNRLASWLMAKWKL